MAFSGLVIAALGGGSGKTILSVGIIAALRRQGYRVAPFKKGPDYIDAGWLALAGGRPCYNLDTFLISSAAIRHSFQKHTQNQHLAVIEGNRGLFDGIDATGSTSTAELAKLLNLPVILCLDCTKTTRTVAAVVCGCQHFDPALRIAGVVLNRVAGSRHEGTIRQTIADYCGIPVVGALPKLTAGTFPERHMGLVPTCEHQWAQEAVKATADFIQAHTDLPHLLKIAGGSYQPDPVADQTIGTSGNLSGLPGTAPSTLCSTFSRGNLAIVPSAPNTPARCRIGILQDGAFQFYYPENIEALVAAGAELVFSSPLRDEQLPEVDGLYIGGGFPETHASQLENNQTYRNGLKALADQGLPIYAECGGLMYLGESLALDSGTFQMAGVLPLVFGFFPKPQGHGYTRLRVIQPNPFFDVGTDICGHEFHYSRVLNCKGQAHDFAFSMERGRGILNRQDGFCYRNTLATYTHIHALGTPQWAPALVQQAEKFNICRQGVRSQELYRTRS